MRLAVMFGGVTSETFDPAPLSGAQKAALDDAAVRLHTLLRPARIASVNAWTLGIFGALTLIWGVVGGGGVLIGLALLTVAWNERRGRDRLRALDPDGARILAWNQLILAGVVTAYCLVTIVRARLAPDPSLQRLEALAGLPADLVADLTTLVYGSVILVVGFVQVLLARYHARREAPLEAFRESTPGWVVELLATTSRGSA